MDDEQRQNVRLWIDALRSGDYQQGAGTLRQGGKYCCLGVACDLYQKHGPGDLHVDSMTTGSGAYTKYDLMTGNLPEKVRRWLGLRNRSGQYNRARADQSTLTELNDSGATFQEIADTIEQAIKNPEMRMFSQ